MRFASGLLSQYLPSGRVRASSGRIAKSSDSFGRYIMKSFAQKIQRFLKSEDGPTAVEYAVMLSLIIVVCITAVTSIGSKAKTTFTNVAAQLGTSS